MKCVVKICDFFINKIRDLYYFILFHFIGNNDPSFIVFLHMGNSSQFCYTNC